MCFTKVNIHDPISKVLDCFKGEATGSVMHNGKIIENPNDSTFAKELISQN